MEDVEAIIYMALSNQVVLYQDLLEDNKDNPDFSDEDKTLSEHILKRSEELAEEYRLKILDKDTTIKRPNW